MSENGVGNQGEFTGHYLQMHGTTQVVAGSLHHPDASAPYLLHEVEAWMQAISPGMRISLQSYPDMDLVSLKYQYSEGSDISNPRRATNVGFGISYTLPIVITALTAKPGMLLILENPEAHLHPRGQYEMGRLLGLAASAGIQVLMETHSDHVLNGIRVAVAERFLAPESVALHFFERRVEGDQAVHSVISPKMDADGRMDQWPEGFFDEWDKALERLLNPGG